MHSDWSVWFEKVLRESPLLTFVDNWWLAPVGV